MNRRSFLKRAGMLIGLSYVAPLSLIEPTQIINSAPGNVLMTQAEMASEALGHLEYSLTFIQPAMEKLCDNIDEDIWRAIKNGS